MPNKSGQNDYDDCGDNDIGVDIENDLLRFSHIDIYVCECVCCQEKKGKRA